MVGLEFTYNDGEKESYDPVYLEFGLYENAFEYVVNGDYIIIKDKVKSFRIYDLCDECGYELHDDESKCHNWGCINNLDIDNQDYFKVKFRNMKLKKLL